MPLDEFVLCSDYIYIFLHKGPSACLMYLCPEIHYPCWYHNGDTRTGHVFLHRRPGGGATKFAFDTHCMAAGAKIFIRSYFVNTQAEVCWTSQKFRKWVEILPRYDGGYERYATTIVMPPVPFITLSVKENIFSSGGPLVVLFLRPAFRNNLCCVLHLSILANPLSNVSFEKISVAEFTNVRDPDIFGNNLVWTYPTPLSPSKGEEINGLMYILKRVSIPLNSLHQDIMLYVHGIGRQNISNLCGSICSTFFLEFEYNFTLYSVTNPTEKALKNYTCAVATNSCYSFTLFPKMTWNSAVGYCSYNNKSLLTTPSDLEWNFISHLFAQRPDILQLGSGMQLSYIGLLYNWVSVIPRGQFH